MKCPYCGSSATKEFFRADMPNILTACPPEMHDRVKRHTFSARLCGECLLGFNSSRLSNQELSAIYDDYLYISPRRGIGQSKYEDMIGTLERTFLRDQKIVEVGCSEGYLLHHLKRAGFRDLSGFEPGPQAVEAEALDLDITRSYFEDGSLPDGSVDGFYLMHVFEHFPDPFAVLAAMRQALSSGGSIVIEVPLLDGFHHQHLYFYSAPFMRRLAREQDLKIVDIDPASPFILRIVLAHKSDPRPEAETVSEDVAALAARRQEVFRTSLARLDRIMEEYRGKTVLWWGTGSQAVLLLNQLETTRLSAINLEVTDGDERKWGYRLPCLNLPVKTYHGLSGQTIDCVVIASQFEHEIRQTMESIGLEAGQVEVFSE